MMFGRNAAGGGTLACVAVAICGKGCMHAA